MAPQDRSRRLRMDCVCAGQSAHRLKPVLPKSKAKAPASPVSPGQAEGGRYKGNVLPEPERGSAARFVDNVEWGFGGAAEMGEAGGGDHVADALFAGLRAET